MTWSRIMKSDSQHGPESANNAEERVLTALRHLISLPASLARIHEGLEKVGAQLNAQLQAQAAYQERLDRGEEAVLAIRQGLEGLFRKQDVLDRASQEQSLLADRHYYEHVILPLVRHVSPIHDWSTELLLNGTGGSFDHGGQISKFAEAIQAQVKEWLAVYGIEPLNAPPGCRYDPKTMSALNPSDADGAGHDVVVTESVRIGLRCGERILREQVVRVRKLADRRKWNLL